MIENRRYRRVDFREPVQLQVLGCDKGDGCICRDISEGGIRINFNDFIPENTGVTIKFSLGAGELFDAPGKVIWSQRVPHGESYQMGLEFSNNDRNSFVKKRIRQFIETI